MADAIVERILREAGVPDLVEVLAERLSPGDLQSLLLEVYRRRAEALSPRDVAEQWARSRFVRPSASDARRFLEVDRLAFSLLPDGCEPIELSPLCPLGTSSAIAPIDQHRMVSTARNVEVLADSTNAMALECASRRRQILRRTPRATDRVKLAASARVVRAQRFEGPESTAHFRLIGLCTAGRDEGDSRFEAESLLEQVEFHLRLLDGARELGSPLVRFRVTLSDFADGRSTPWLQERVAAPLAERFPDAEILLDPERERARGYYRTACFLVHAAPESGEPVELVDGGFTPWTERLLSDRRERLLISGFGVERLAARL